MNNDHFKYTSNANNIIGAGGCFQEAPGESKLDHLLRTNAALALMSKINLLTNLQKINNKNNNRHSIASTNDLMTSMNGTIPVSLRQKSYNVPSANNQFRRRSRPTSFVLSESVISESLVDISSFESHPFKRSFAPTPSTTLHSLLFKSGIGWISIN